MQEETSIRSREIDVTPSKLPSSSFINRYKQYAPATALGAATLGTATLAGGAALRDSGTDISRDLLAATALFTLGATTLGFIYDALNKPQPSTARKVIASATAAAAIGCTTVLSIGVSKPDFDDRRPFLWAGGGPIAVALLLQMAKEIFVSCKGSQQIDGQLRFPSVGEKLASLGFLSLSLSGAIGAAIVGATNKDDLGHFKNEAITPAILGSLAFLLMNIRRFLTSKITNQLQIPLAAGVNSIQLNTIGNRA